jgi:autotransporter translocation and assembly factor TamB
VFKWTGIGLGGLIVLVLVTLYIPGVKHWAFEQGRSILTEAGVQSEGIGGDWTRMTLTNVALNDDQGTWATASEVVLSWSPWGLLSFTIDATHVEFRGARVLRQPAYKPAPEQADEPFAWPDLPVDITLESLTGDVTLDAAVIGEALTAELDGKAALTSTGGDAALALKRTDGVQGKRRSRPNRIPSSQCRDRVQRQGCAGCGRTGRRSTLPESRSRLPVDSEWQRMHRPGLDLARDGSLLTLGVNPNCTFAIQLPEVARLLDPSANLAGPANLSVQLKEDGTDKTTHFQLAADLSKLVSNDETLARLLPGASAGALVMFTADGVRLNNLQGQLANGKIAFTGSALLGKFLQAKADLNASDLSVLRDDLQGQLQASVGYDAASATPIAFTAKGTNIVSGGLAWSEVDAVGSVDARGSGEVTLKAAGPAPIDVAVTVADAFGGAVTVTAKGTIAEAKLDARAVQSGEAYAVDATIETRRLENLGAIANLDVAGGLNARISGTVGDKAGGLNLEATVSNARYGRTEIGDAAFTAKGPMSALEVTLKGRAPLAPRVVDYTLAATVNDLASARVSSLELRSATERLTATQPFTVSFAEDILVKDFAATVARSGKAAGAIVANAELTPRGARADVTVTSVDLEALTALLGQDPVRGTLNATASLDGGAGTAQLSGTIEGLRAGTDRVPPATLALDGAWARGDVTLGVTARAQGLPDAVARISFPMARAADGGFPSPAPNAPLDGTIDWSGRLAPLWRLADIGNADFDGDARIQGRIAGTLSDPKFSGSGTLANGSFSDEKTGVRLVQLSLAANSDGDRLTVKGSASDGAQGRLEIDAATTLGRRHRSDQWRAEADRHAALRTRRPAGAHRRNDEPWPR